MERVAIDLGRTDLARLFAEMFLPTLAGLLSGVVLNVADGVFVGRGVGSGGLAAVNIAAPIFLFAYAVSLLFGSGVSVVAAMHLARGEVRSACMNITQALTVSLTLMLLLAAVIFAFPVQTGRMFGGSDALMPMVVEYLRWVVPQMPFSVAAMIGMFAIRLDGAPRFAMLIEVVPALLNIVLDYLFIFPFGWGIGGAAAATSASQLAGALLAGWYMLRHARTVRLCRPGPTLNAMRLTARNTVRQARLGFPNFLGEMAIAVMIMAGNAMFIGRLGEDGVAAYSVVCYLFPMIFMFGYAISLSAQPIASFNHGQGNMERVRGTLRISVCLAVALGLLLTAAGFFWGDFAIGCFLSGGQPARALAVQGFPYFSAGFLFFTLNMVLIGFYQSIGRARPATIFMLLRGFVLLVPSFVLLPSWLGDAGLWLAVPLSEALTFAVIAGYMAWEKRDAPPA
jgi:putative MATE family efflux protein